MTDHLKLIYDKPNNVNNMSHKVYSKRVYSAKDCVVFRKTKEAFGGLSNMASGYSIEVNRISILSSEALYQSCRYPHLPEVQMEIINQKSPMASKMHSKKYHGKSRLDWEDIKVNIMRWCLRIKLAQNFLKFGQQLEATGNKNIVEDSKRDDFWGAKSIDSETFVGINALGRLLMELRQAYNSEQRLGLLYVEPPKIENFLLIGKPIPPIDCRKNFANYFSTLGNERQLKF